MITRHATLVTLTGRGSYELIPRSKTKLDYPHKGDIHALSDLSSQYMLCFMRWKLSRTIGEKTRSFLQI